MSPEPTLRGGGRAAIIEAAPSGSRTLYTVRTIHGAGIKAFDERLKAIQYARDIAPTFPDLWVEEQITLAPICRRIRHEKPGKPALRVVS